MQSSENKISFIQLAKEVISLEKKPLSIEEIWAIAEKLNLTSRLRSLGKTPEATLGAQLYTNVKKTESEFLKIGSRPSKFILKELAQGLPNDILTQASEPSRIVPDKSKYSERDLHPFAVWFIDKEFGAYCKTIYHESSIKKGANHNTWIHPDIVAF